MEPTITRVSYLNLYQADSWDVWHLDHGNGVMLVLFLNGFSAVVSTHEGPFVWEDEQSAVNYLIGHRPNLPRFRSDPGPR